MTPEMLKDTILNYRFLLGEMKELADSLRTTESMDWMRSVGLSSNEERMMNRLESHQRRLECLGDAIEHAGLNDLEFTAVFWSMEGMSFRQIGKRILRKSDRHVGRIFDSAVTKLAGFIEHGNVG